MASVPPDMLFLASGITPNVVRQVFSSCFAMPMPVCGNMHDGKRRFAAWKAAFYSVEAAVLSQAWGRDVCIYETCAGVGGNP